MTPKTWVSSSLAVLLVLMGCGGSATDTPAPSPAENPVAENPVDVEPPARQLLEFPDLGGDFTLTDHRGEPFRFADSNGRIRLLFFGYTSCPDVCPQTLSKIVRVHRTLGEEAEKVTTLFVSVDPERDPPERLAEYLDYFELGDAVALTGEPAEIDAVLESFKARFEKVERGSAAGYLIDHTSYIYLIDQRGMVRAIFRHSELPEEIGAAIRLLVAEETA